MTQTVVDQRGRVLIPEDLREEAGLDDGTIVNIEQRSDGIVITRLRKGRRTWRQLCGILPERTGRPEWPSPEEIKSIWR